MKTAARSSAEGNLAVLLACTRPRADVIASKQIAELARSAPDWDSLLALAEEHCLTPNFCKNVLETAGDALDSERRQRLQQESLRRSCRNLALTAELFRVLEAFESKGVIATAYKGPVLAAQAYGDAAMREFSDLDIIVPQQQIAAAHSALLDLGFQPVLKGLAGQGSQRIPGQYAYKNDLDTLVEVHTEFTLRYFPRRLNLAELCERREVERVAGRRVLAFSREDTLLLLSVHGAKHFWERLSWIADIAALAEAPRRIDWAVALDRAGRWGVRRMLLLGAGLASELFQMPLDSQLADCLREDHIARRLIGEISQRFEPGDQADLGVFRRFTFRVRMRGSLPRGVAYAVRLAVMPTELDRGPGGQLLEPLYALWRPLRLARTYGWRSQRFPKLETNTSPKSFEGLPRN